MVNIVVDCDDWTISVKQSMAVIRTSIVGVLTNKDRSNGNSSSNSDAECELSADWNESDDPVPAWETKAFIATVLDNMMLLLMLMLTLLLLLLLSFISSFPTLLLPLV